MPCTGMCCLAQACVALCKHWLPCAGSVLTCCLYRHCMCLVQALSLCFQLAHAPSHTSLPTSTLPSLLRPSSSLLDFLLLEREARRLRGVVAPLEELVHSLLARKEYPVARLGVAVVDRAPIVILHATSCWLFAHRSTLCLLGGSSRSYSQPVVLQLWHSPSLHSPSMLRPPALLFPYVRTHRRLHPQWPDG